MIVADHDFLVLAHHTAFNAADCDTADIFVVVNGRDEQLQGPFAVALGSGNIVNNGVEQRLQVNTRFMRAVRRGTLTAGAEYSGRVELLFGGIKVEQQLQNLVHDFINTGVGFIHLVDNDDDLVLQL